MLIGKVLWWDDRDGIGVIKDVDGRKFYFDVSVLTAQQRGKMKSGVAVRFEQNPEIPEALCARKVALASSREQSRLEKQIVSRLQMELFA